jgi:hypothetical protein
VRGKRKDQKCKDERRKVEAIAYQIPTVACHITAPLKVDILATNEHGDSGMKYG